MKNIKRISLLLLVIAIMTCFCFAVNAEGDVSIGGKDDVSVENNSEQQSNQENQNNTPASPLMQFLQLGLPIIILVAFFYFGMYRPQKKQEKEKKAMMDSLQVGSEIMTIGGIMGRIVSVKEDSVIIESGADKNKLQISKNAISTVK